MGRPDGRYSLVDVEGEAERDIATVASFHSGVKIPVVVITTLVTALASVLGTYYSTHGGTGDYASRGDVSALDKRIGDLQQTVSTLTVTVNANADRSHNDVAILNGTLMALTRAAK